MNASAPTHDEYRAARDALAALCDERARVLPRGLDALRAWLAAGAGERWLKHEGVVQRARAQDLALSMWWEAEWRRERTRRQRAAEKVRRVAPAPTAAAEPEKGTVQRDSKTAAPRPIARPAGARRPAHTPAPSQNRSFAPGGPVWRP